MSTITHTHESVQESPVRHTLIHTQIHRYLRTHTHTHTLTPTQLHIHMDICKEVAGSVSPPGHYMHLIGVACLKKKLSPPVPSSKQNNHITKHTTMTRTHA